MLVDWAYIEFCRSSEGSLPSEGSRRGNSYGNINRQGRQRKLSFLCSIQLHYNSPRDDLVRAIQPFVPRNEMDGSAKPTAWRTVFNHLSRIARGKTVRLRTSPSSLLLPSLELSMQKSMDLKYEPASEPLHIHVKYLILNGANYANWT